MNKPVQTYIMKSGNKYKIGRSGNTPERLKSLKTGNPDIEILLYCLEGRVSEKTLHNMFAHRRGGGEWFSLTDSDITICKNLMGKCVKLPQQDKNRADGKVSCTYWITPELKEAVRVCSFFSGLTKTELAEEALANHVRSFWDNFEPNKAVLEKYTKK